MYILVAMHARIDAMFFNVFTGSFAFFLMSSEKLAVYVLQCVERTHVDLICCRHAERGPDLSRAP
jgi:hypothetical protein